MIVLQFANFFLIGVLKANLLFHSISFFSIKRKILDRGNGFQKNDEVAICFSSILAFLVLN